MTGVIGRGILAGAVGTLMLDVASYADMLLTGRGASSAPAETVLRTVRAAGLEPPDDDSRREAYGALGGMAAGLGVGVLVATAHRAGVRLPGPLGVAVTGAVAMAATDAPMAITGVADPSDWTASDWIRDVAPHLAFGLGVRWTLDALEQRPSRREKRRRLHRPSARTVGTAVGRTVGGPVGGVVGGAVGGVASRHGDDDRYDDRYDDQYDGRYDDQYDDEGLEPAGAGVVTRSLLLGLAAGSRSSLGLLVPAWSGTHTSAKVVTGALVAGEMVADKLPQAPSRIEAGGLGARLVSGAAGAAALAAQEDSRPWLPVAGGLVGAFAGSVVGAAWRDTAADRGWGWRGALGEDVAALLLARLAIRS